MRIARICAVAGMVALAGCESTPDPAPPPTSEAALTTVSAEADDEQTDEAASTSGGEAGADRATEEPVTDGPPEMPNLAMEQTGEGAEAFVEHYVALINYTARSPESGLLEPLGGPDCQSCRNHEEAVAYGVENGDYLAGDTFVMGKVDSLFMGDSSRVTVDIDQPQQTYLRDGVPIDRELPSEQTTLVFRTAWDDGWKIQEITIQQ